MGRNTRQLTRRQRTAASVTTGAGMTAYQGASHSDLALRDWQPLAGSPDADLLPELDTLTSRSRDLALSRYSALVLGYNGEYGSGSRDQSASVKVRWAF